MTADRRLGQCSVPEAESHDRCSNVAASAHDDDARCSGQPEQDDAKHGRPNPAWRAMRAAWAEGQASGPRRGYARTPAHDLRVGLNAVKVDRSGDRRAKHESEYRECQTRKRLDGATV